MTKHVGWIALIGLAVIPYLAAIHAPLLYDDRTLLDNRWLAREASPVSVFEHDYWHGTKHAGSDLYRPLTVLSLSLNLQAAGTKEGIRAANIALHAAAVLLLFGVLGGIASPEAAWIGAALFAVHPLTSEAVLWAVGRAELGAAILGMAALLLFLRSSYVLSAAALFGALGFKESAVAWLVIGAVWVALHRSEARAPARARILRALPFAVAIAAYAALRVAAVGWSRHAPPFIDNPLAGTDAATRAVNAVLLLGRYVAKMLWPQTLSVDYGFDQIPVIPVLPWGGLAAAAMAGAWIAAIVVLHRRGRRAAAFLVAFVPAAFVVTANLLFPLGTIFAERLAYTPLIGVCGLAGLALAAIPRAAWRRAAIAVLLLALAGRSFVRCADYASLGALSEATAAASPRSVKALFNAGRTRLRQGDAAGASQLLRRAVTIRPGYAGAWRTLADAYTALGDTVRAAEAASRADAARADGGDDPL